MKPYSEDLRRRIIRAVQVGGISKSAAARLFDVSLSSVKRYVRIANRGASLEPRKGGGSPPKVNQSTEKLLEEDVHKRPAATVSERRHFLQRLNRQKPQRLHCKAGPQAAGLQSKNGVWGRQNETSGEESSGG
jgi:transposase